jgi:hypothetical protein
MPSPLFVVVLFCYICVVLLSVFWWQHCPSGHNAHMGSALVAEFFLFYDDQRNTSSEENKKPSLLLLLGCEFSFLGVMAGVVYGGRRSCSRPPKKKKKTIPLFDDCVVGTMICGHRLSLLLLFL